MIFHGMSKMPEELFQICQIRKSRITLSEFRNRETIRP